MIAKIVREPLGHFLVIAAALLWLWHRWGGQVLPDRPTIAISSGVLARDRAIFRATHLREPDPAEWRVLIDQEIRTQVFVREAIALGLDRDDEVISRRLQQKLQFVLRHDNEVPPTDAELELFWRKHQDEFTPPATLSFTQVYLNPVLHFDLAADAADLRARLTAGGDTDPISGDPLPVERNFAAARPAQIDAIFGGGFARTLEAAPVGQWVGPIGAVLAGDSRCRSARLGRPAASGR
jgi:hypothetical protein